MSQKRMYGEKFFVEVQWRFFFVSVITKGFSHEVLIPILYLLHLIEKA